jgi:metal-responsive CopG/Arc/MetJ family transcriptional regulator
MKTAISIPDPVFREAEALAAELGLSRSALYAEAVREYLAARSRARVTEKLDSIYRIEPARLDPGLVAIQSASVPTEEW